MDFVASCYEWTRKFPSDERFGLTHQLRRAAFSIPSNIAEGKGRGTIGAYLNHLSIALGSIAEVDTQIVLAVKLKYIELSVAEPVLKDLEEIGRMVSGLRKSIKNSPNS